MSCDVGKATEALENELWLRWSDGKVGEWAELIVIVIAELILQPFRHFTYVTTHFSILQSLYLCQSSFSKPSVASPTSQFILQPFFRFSYVTSSSLNSPGKPPMRQVIHRKLRKQRCSFTRDWTGEVAPLCFPHPTLSLASEQILKYLKTSKGHQRGGEESGFC